MYIGLEVIEIDLSDAMVCLVPCSRLAHPCYCLHQKPEVYWVCPRLLVANRRWECVVVGRYVCVCHEYAVGRHVRFPARSCRIRNLCREVTVPAIHLGPVPKFCMKTESPSANDRFFIPLLSWHCFWAS